ncbi:MAG: hypothetical protein AMXMBFR56_68320 [Polyangiaceae bacterium]
MTMADPSGDVAPTIHDQDFWTRKMVYKVVYPSEAADAFLAAFAEEIDKVRRSMHVEDE